MSLSISPTPASGSARIVSAPAEAVAEPPPLPALPAPPEPSEPPEPDPLDPLAVPRSTLAPLHPPTPSPRASASPTEAAIRAFLRTAENYPRNRELSLRNAARRHASIFSERISRPTGIAGAGLAAGAVGARPP